MQKRRPERFFDIPDGCFLTEDPEDNDAPNEMFDSIDGGLEQSIQWDTQY